MTQNGKQSCCGPVEAAGSPDRRAGVPDANSREAGYAQTVAIPGGQALVGTASEIIHHDGEAPIRKVRLAGFRMDKTAVSNARFAEFVEATGYRTDAERIGWSYVFFRHMQQDAGPNDGVAAAPWWRRVEGASWRHINGHGSEMDWKEDHPVVQVSWNDAEAFAAWAGGRLPSEAEWEHAARGGLGDVRFPWGDAEPDETDFLPCNVWQGAFPERDTGADGFTATAPAESFEPNGYGLYNMCGNVWEWTRDAFKIRSMKKAARQRQKERAGYKTLKGGSFLCHRSYCYRYRIAARGANSPDSTASHQGFRLVYDAP